MFGGLVLIVVSMVFPRGLIHELKPFFYFGSLMLAIFGALYTLVFLAKGFDALATGEEWCPLRAEILMFPLAVPGLVNVQQAKKDSTIIIF
ncbi:hypothetical protein [Archaeoglobus sp.]